MGAPPAPAPPPPPSHCDEPERRQLEFWLGDWDLVVRAPAAPGEAWSEARGISSIKATLGGCAIEENFHADGPGAPWAGRSFSTYQPATHVWRQTWVDDSGGYLPFHGGPEGASFVLYGEEARPMRMVFRDVTERSLLWSWERKIPGGWSPVMTIAYTRRSAAPPAATCEADPGFHELDFWLGSWRVMVDGRLAGKNRIEKTLAGCGVTETWTDADGSEGRSLFFHPPGSSSWKQVWLTTQSTALGGAKEKQLVSRGVDGSLRFQGELPLPAGGVLLDRTTLTPLSGGRVHQVIEVSRDDGAHWKTTFDAIYERV